MMTMTQSPIRTSLKRQHRPATDKTPQVVEAFKNRSNDHKKIIEALQYPILPEDASQPLPPPVPITVERIAEIDVKLTAKRAKCSVRHTGEILQELTTALELGITSKRKVFIPEYSKAEFDQIFERFCERSPEHRIVAETALHDPNASTRDREALNKTRLAEITKLEQKRVEELLAELRTAFAEFG